jgi:hypothetical protein
MISRPQAYPSAGVRRNVRSDRRLGRIGTEAPPCEQESGLARRAVALGQGAGALELGRQRRQRRARLVGADALLLEVGPDRLVAVSPVGEPLRPCRRKA